MWNDKETNIDLIGFNRYSQIITELIKSGDIQPSTLGLFGDWGSGKSSVLTMIENTLKEDNDVLIIKFDSWQFEGYDDAKAALMSTIVNSIPQEDKIKDQFNKVLKKIDWFRFGKLISKGVISLAVPQLGMFQAPGLLKEGVGFTQDTIKGLSNNHEALAEISQSIREFRAEFKELISNCDIKTLLIIIDDLDRCLPDSIISTLEAIKLFLAIEQTVFIIAADEAIVRDAVLHRFGASDTETRSIADDYLEKLIQIPIKIPPMDRTETERYIILLLLWETLNDGQFDKLIKQVDADRKDPNKRFNITEQYIHECVDEIKVDLSDLFKIGYSITPILASKFQGNPRQIKRFLNVLKIRQLVAQNEQVVFENSIMVKLMLLERFHKKQFQDLYKWQESQSGNPQEIIELENIADGKQENINYKEWDDEELINWLKLEPSLKGVDLTPYFFLSREMLSLDYTAGKKLSQLQRSILTSLLSESASYKKKEEAKISGMSIDDIEPIYEELIGRLEKDFGNEKAFGGILIISYAKEEFAKKLLGYTNLNNIFIGKSNKRITDFANIANSHAALKNDIVKAIENVKAASENRKLKGTIDLVLKNIKGD